MSTNRNNWSLIQLSIYINFADEHSIVGLLCWRSVFIARCWQWTPNAQCYKESHNDFSFAAIHCTQWNARMERLFWHFVSSANWCIPYVCRYAWIRRVHVHVIALLHSSLVHAVFRWVVWHFTRIILVDIELSFSTLNLSVNAYQCILYAHLLERKRFFTAFLLEVTHLFNAFHWNSWEFLLSVHLIVHGIVPFVGKMSCVVGMVKFGCCLPISIVRTRWSNRFLLFRFIFSISIALFLLVDRRWLIWFTITMGISRCSMICWTLTCGFIIVYPFDSPDFVIVDAVNVNWMTQMNVPPFFFRFLQWKCCKKF